MHLKEMTDKQLLINIKKEVAIEKRQTFIVLKHLQEIERRGCHLDLGYWSLQSYAVGELGYSDAQASLRIAAMRLLKENSVAEKKIGTGELNLTVAADLSRQIRMSDEEIGGSKVNALVEKVSGMSSRLAEKEIRREIQVSGVREKKIVLKDRLLKMFERIDPTKSELEIIEELLVEKLKRVEVKKESKVEVKNSRYISKQVKRKIQKRSAFQCEFVGTKGRCQEKRFLEFDHKVAFSKGGGNGEENIQYLCRAHNQRKGAVQLKIPGT